MHVSINNCWPTNIEDDIIITTVSFVTMKMKTKTIKNIELFYKYLCIHLNLNCIH